MEETLLAYPIYAAIAIAIAVLPAILAVILAVVLRWRRSRREASDQIKALQQKLTALQQRTLELERAQKQTPAPNTPIFSDSPELTLRLQLFAQSQREMDKACKRLHAMKAELAFEYIVAKKYVAELNSIVMSLEKASGRDLSRWLGSSSQRGAGVWSHDRDKFRLRILSLLAFCTYQSYHPQLPTISSTRASRLIH